VCGAGRREAGHPPRLGLTRPDTPGTSSLCKGLGDGGVIAS
jgi:hypothetical protein